MGGPNGSPGSATAPPDVYDTPLPASRCDPADALCVDLAATQPLWWTEDGWSVYEAWLGDVDGDGDLDAAIQLWFRSPDGEWAGLHRTSIVLAPFGNPKVLPRDEDVSIEGTTFAVADGSGDGIADVVLNVGHSMEPELSILIGPFSPGPVDETAAHPIPPGFGEWVGGPVRNGVGGPLVYARWGGVGDSVEQWSGSWDTWGVGTPTLTAHVGCDDPYDCGAWCSWPVGDIDGDGLDELRCGAHITNWYLPGTTTGDVFLPGSVDALAAEVAGEEPVPLGDVNGDGRDDFSFQRQWLAGPLAMSASGFSGGAPLFSATPVDGLEPTYLDLDRDGLLDFRRSVAQVPGTPVDWSDSGLAAHLREYLTAAAGGGVYTGQAVGRIVHDDPYSVIHLEHDGPHVLGWWQDGDGVVLVRVPGT